MDRRFTRNNQPSSFVQLLVGPVSVFTGENFANSVVLPQPDGGDYEQQRIFAHIWFSYGPFAFWALFK